MKELNKQLFNQMDDFFNQPRTIQDLREELNKCYLDLTNVIKSVEQLFYEIFDEEEYEIKDLLGTSGSTQYVVINKIEGHEITFDISDDYNIFNLVASGIFFANKYTTKWWLKYLELLEEVHTLIFDFKHPELDIR